MQPASGSAQHTSPIVLIITETPVASLDTIGPTLTWAPHRNTVANFYVNPNDPMHAG